MSLSTAFLDELRARTVLSSVIAPSVKLLRAGREWKACCPFHKEKTPSFTVNDDKGFYHCFGCGAHGDAIRFLTDHRGMPFMDAVKELASKAGMEVPAPDPQAKERADRAASLTDVMAEVAKWYSEQLNGLGGADARDYLKRRGIDAQTIQRFGIGFAPDSRSALKRALEKLGEDKLIDTGMLIKPEDGDSYDRFRGRLMIPIRDARGRVIAFGGRILGQGEPKYLNSPDTVLFDKGRTLYNIDQGSPASRIAKRLIVVEGYMDVIALDRAGISEVVAPNGTAVTEAQLERMWRLDPSPILCFDGDSAGQKAAYRAAIRALPNVGPDKTLKICVLPPGKDPDDLIKHDGRPAFDRILTEARNLHQFLWTAELEREPLDTPESRANLGRRLRSLAQTIQDADVRTQYLGLFNGLLNEMYENLRKSRRFEIGSSSLQRRNIPPELLAIAKEGMTQAVEIRVILNGLLRYPTLIGELAEPIASLWIKNRGWAQIRETMLTAALLNHPLEHDTLQTTLQQEGLAQRLKEMCRSPELPYTFLKEEASKAVAERDLAAVIEKVLVVASFEAASADAQRRYAEAADENEAAEIVAELERIQAARAASGERFREFWADARENESTIETA